MVDSNQLAAFDIGVTGPMPKSEGKRAFPINLDFSVENSIDVDLQLLADQKKFSALWTLFVNNVSDLTLTFAPFNQKYRLAADGSGAAISGFFPLALVNPPRFTAVSTPFPGNIIQLIFYNYSIKPVVWNAF